MSAKPKLSTLKPRLATLDTRRGGVPQAQRITGPELQRTRNRIFLRDKYTCRKCGRVRVASDLEVDHIVPLHLGGAESDENRQCLCRECHAVKSAGEEKGRGG